MKHRTRTRWSSRRSPASLAVSATSCSGEKFGKTRNPPRLVVELDPASKVGARDAPLPLAVDIPVSFRATIRALAENGADRHVVQPLRARLDEARRDRPAHGARHGRTQRPPQGAASPSRSRSRSRTRTASRTSSRTTSATLPKDPLADPPPACSNGIDDDGDGTIDFPADPGCAFANDDSEEGGTFSEGVSTPIYFKLPRIADIRGLKCEPTLGCSGNGATPYPREAIQVDTGFRDDGSFAFDTVVTRISADGFYVTDLGDTRGTPPGTAGFNSVFAFNFNAPPRMRTCDRMKTYGGTANEFFGFTQMNYPTWTLEEWDPARRPCLVPEPERLTPTLIGSPPELLKRSATWCASRRHRTAARRPWSRRSSAPATCRRRPAASTRRPADASNCDFDKNGKITFAVGNPENDCNAACTADPECTEWSNYVARSTFRITVTDSNGKSAAVQADATASAQFDPVALKGQPLRYFAGTLGFFSGGAQYTIEVRCKDDITVALKEATFLTDRACTVDDECTTKAGFPPDFKCVPLSDGAKACRKLDPEKPDVKEPPPLACVFPRTFLENNPQ